MTSDQRARQATATIRDVNNATIQASENQKPLATPVRQLAGLDPSDAL